MHIANLQHNMSPGFFSEIEPCQFALKRKKCAPRIP